MAHVSKYTKGNMQGLSIHLDRKTANHSNKDIDNARAHLNYDLRGEEGDTLKRLNARLSDVHCLNRKDVKVCAEWLVTLPEGLKTASTDNQRLFFETSYQFLCARYGGEKNVVSANVHNDETTPHLHFAFVPVVYDQKNAREKVSAKEVLTRKELQAFHQAFDAYLREQIPHIYQGGVLNGKTVGIENVHALKQATTEVNERLVALKQQLDTIKRYQDPLNVVTKLEAHVTVKSKGFFGSEKVMQLPEKEYEQLVQLAKSTVNLNVTTDKLQANNAQLQTTIEKIRGQRDVFQANYEATLRKSEALQQKIIVYESMLKDDGRNLTISQDERIGRIVLHHLENGREPKNLKDNEKWLAILEKNQQQGLIPSHRLNKYLEVFKAKVRKAVEVSMGFVRNKVTDQRPSKPTKSRSQDDGMSL